MGALLSCLKAVSGSRRNRVPVDVSPTDEMKTFVTENLTLPSDSLVDVHAIGPALFGSTPPSQRTIRSLTKRGILPHFRIGRLVRYDVAMVRAALEKHCLVQG